MDSETQDNKERFKVEYKMKMEAKVAGREPKNIVFDQLYKILEERERSK